MRIRLTQPLIQRNDCVICRRKPKEIAELDDDHLRPSTSLCLDIVAWLFHLHNVCPKLREYLDNYSIPIKASEVDLCLPSSFSKDDQVKYSLKHLATRELELRKGEAFDIIRNLRAAVRVDSQHRYKKNKQHVTHAMKTRTNKHQINARLKKIYWMNEYRVVRKKMLSLGLEEMDETFRPLIDADLYRPTHSEPVEFSAKPVGWIWTVSLKSRGDVESAIAEWEKEGV